jgi:hypothetical protein
MLRLNLHSIAVCAAMLLVAGAAQAQSHIVFVNGRLLSDAEVMALARLNCTDIPDGSYWLDMNTGAWGYAGNSTVQGRLGDGCRGGNVVGGVNRDGTIGPYATLRRAEEIANQYRAMGFRAVAFHNGNGYYIRVSK